MKLETKKTKKIIYRFIRIVHADYNGSLCNYRSDDSTNQPSHGNEFYTIAGVSALHSRAPPESTEVCQTSRTWLSGDDVGISVTGSISSSPAIQQPSEHIPDPLAQASPLARKYSRVQPSVLE